MLVEELLRQEKLDYRESGKDYLVKCLNPEHDDSNPSMRIDKITGIFNCFSCHYKGNIFTFFDEVPNALQQKREFLKRLIHKKKIEDIGLEMPSGYEAYTGNWRNISPETYIKFKAFQHLNYPGRLVFPITDFTGKIVVFLGRDMGMETPKYKVDPEGVSLPLYPVVKPTNGRIMLVEGIFDAINLHDKGITNAVACFGVGAVNKQKLNLLKISGATHIDTFFDGDTAGQEGASKVKDLCEIVGLLHRNICLDGKDPGMLSKESVLKLKEKLYD